jgi:hypothetical protein
MNKGISSLIGFGLLICGMLALVLQFVGVQLVFLTWLDNWGGGLGFLFRILIIVIGFVIIVVTRSGEQVHDEFF